jgi:quaternary ammonium compound-resistance protein SugE
MNWFILIIAGFFEVGFATCLAKAKETTGTSSTLWMIGSFITLSIGTSYAVWTGIGAAGTVLVGILFFKEPADFWRLFFLSTLICSIIGLKFVSH